MIDFGILAAGEGSRLKAGGELLPKPLLELEGRPLIGRLLEIIKKCNPRSISVIVNENMPDVAEYLEKEASELAVNLKFATVSTPSSMHSFHELLQVMKPTGKFLVTTVDTVFKEDKFKEFVYFFENMPHEIDGMMGVTDFIDDEKPLYVTLEGRHRITGFLDEASENCKYVSAGVYGLQTSVFPILQKCIADGVSRMRNFQRKLLEAGLNLDAFNLGKVIDVDTVGDLKKAQQLIER